ncbi:antiterminator [Rahnella sp. SAP-1]|uniref:Antiterminator n=1 Tax=Rouxiella aceris TaxID=2703884 RepID=A0A848MF16_9GAMM|nr:bacteriophage antitermination protein Q [Rouxiella aceris]NMP26868.1 antiterminator [Rouxiella aceris]
MNDQYLQYIRDALTLATADFSGRTKGQLVALVEQLQYTNDRYPRKRQVVIDEVTGKKITLTNSPVPGKQSHAKGTSIPLVMELEFSTASWRRALSVLPEQQLAWLSWCYGYNLKFDYQVSIVKHAWAVFELSRAKSLSKKTIEKLGSLVWLAAQDYREIIMGRDNYQYADLAAMMGITKQSFNFTYRDHWDSFMGIFSVLDRDALHELAKTRSTQKKDNSQKMLAKLY